MSNHHHFLYTVRPTRREMVTDKPTARESEILTRHFNHLSELAGRGVVGIAGRTDTNDEETFGIVVFRAESKEEALKIMQSDPAVIEGLMIAELYPFRLAIREWK